MVISHTRAVILLILSVLLLGFSIEAIVKQRIWIGTGRAFSAKRLYTGRAAVWYGVGGVAFSIVIGTFCIVTLRKKDTETYY